MQANSNMSLSGNAQQTFSRSTLIQSEWTSLTPLLSAAVGVGIGLLLANSFGWM